MKLSQHAKINGFKSAKALAEAMQVSYDALYKLYHDESRKDEYSARLEAAKESKGENMANK